MHRHHLVINAHEVRSLVADGYDDWRDLVKAAVAAYERKFGDTMLPIEVPLAEEGSFMIVTDESLPRMVGHIHVMLDALESIASFSPGRSGDIAADALIEIGVWTENVQRVEDIQ